VLVLLPPSETKVLGGVGAPLSYGTLSHPGLTSRRRALARALVKLARHPEAAMLALKLGRTQLAEVERNRQLATSPTMPVIDRYTGVLYDALDAGSLSESERDFAGRHVIVHSALFGPVGALDPIPAYRMSHDSRLPDVALKRHWAADVSGVLGKTEGLLLDLRSEAYVTLGAAPVRADSVFLRVVTETVDGQRRALNHFNKRAKGELTRALLQHGTDLANVDELLAWAADAGFHLRRGAPHELELTVDQPIPARRTAPVAATAS